MNVDNQIVTLLPDSTKNAVKVTVFPLVLIPYKYIIQKRMTRKNAFNPFFQQKINTGVGITGVQLFDNRRCKNHIANGSSLYD